VRNPGDRLFSLFNEDLLEIVASSFIDISPFGLLPKHYLTSLLRLAHP
jgi:hypothetical protein